jgi:hypothetical protein
MQVFGNKALGKIFTSYTDDIVEVINLRHYIMRESVATWKIGNEIEFNHMGCEDGRWVELAHDPIHLLALLLVILNLWILLTENYYLVCLWENIGNYVRKKCRTLGNFCVNNCKSRV